jgi:hypothetical protein
MIISLTKRDKVLLMKKKMRIQKMKMKKVDQMRKKQRATVVPKVHHHLNNQSIQDKIRIKRNSQRVKLWMKVKIVNKMTKVLFMKVEKMKRKRKNKTRVVRMKLMMRIKMMKKKMDLMNLEMKMMKKSQMKMNLKTKLVNKEVKNLKI